MTIVKEMLNTLGLKKEIVISWWNSMFNIQKTLPIKTEKINILKELLKNLTKWNLIKSSLSSQLRKPYKSAVFINCTRIGLLTGISVTLSHAVFDKMNFLVYSREMYSLLN
jgi:hypothetical protein